MITKAPKFYLFDVGVAGAPTKRGIPEARGESFGKALEHFVLMELAAHASYSGLNYEIRCWRPESGHEVDFVVGDGEAAIEVKGASRVDTRDLRPLWKFVDLHGPRLALIVRNEPAPRVTDTGIQILPWAGFLERLWQGELFS